MHMFAATVFATGLAVLYLSVEFGVIWLIFPWLALTWIAQFALFTCPHCHQSAIITPSGWATPFVGPQCKHCGKPY